MAFPIILDRKVEALHHFLFLRHPLGTTLFVVFIYALGMVLLVPHLGVSANYLVLAPVITLAMGYGFWGGLVGGALGLPLNLGFYALLGRMDGAPASWFMAEVSGLILGGVLGYLSDYFRRLTEDVRNKEETRQALRQALVQKELLLKEVHHRVKNNLNLLKSLVQLQMNRSQEPAFLECSRGFKQRIYAMALVFDHLYQGNTFETLALGQYLTDLLDHFFQVYPDYQTVWEVDVLSPHLTLDVEATTTLGLLVSEILTNILKHSFENHPTPRLSLVVGIERDDILLKIGDNGPPWQPQDAKPGLGMKVIVSLAAQLRGRAEWKYEEDLNWFILTLPLHHQGAGDTAASASGQNREKGLK